MSDRNKDVSPSKNTFLGQDQDEAKEVDQGPLGNPTPPPDVDLDKLRGDCIGDTVYSGKWCIQIIMKLMQSNIVLKTADSEDIEEKTAFVDMDEELQNEVGALWDMTINLDVCLYLHSVGAVESVCHIITNSRCPRATEMCVGMLANIITHSELWKILYEDSAIFHILIQLFTNFDQPVLLEVARFFNTALCHRDNMLCYACLCENSPLVTQELMRILAGSTNTDLLKQVAELAYSLMSLDEKNTCFGSLFADADFVSSVVEASKELGYEHETSGQNSVMELLHYFTTYTAGVLAIENVMEQIAETNTHYLKVLCQSLNLSNNSNIITTIIATLNHIFCRHIMVRIGLMSSPSFIHTILKTLVAVYRKLGYYNSIAYPKGRSSFRSTTWKMEEDIPSQRKATETSWSERASVTVSATNTFRTPDASPSQAQQNKELDVSWSERRMSSPIVEDFAVEKWKRPKGKKKLKRREDAKASARYDIESNTSEKDMNVSLFHEEVHSKGDAGKDSNELISFLDEQTERTNLTAHQDDKRALEISHKEQSSDLDSLRKSSEFTPQDVCEEMDSEGEMGEEAIVCPRRVSQRSTATTTEIISADSESLTTLASIDSRALTSPQITPDTDHLTDSNIVFTCALNDSLTKDDLHNVDTSQNNGHGSNDAEHMTGGSDGTNGDKYDKLLMTITEFLVDYFSNLRETLRRDDGTPCIKDVMAYFNTRCSSVEIRAIAKCVGGTGRKITQPLERLLHMCNHFKAQHVKALLIDFVHKDT